MTRNPILTILIILLLKDQFEPAGGNQPSPIGLTTSISPLRIEYIIDTVAKLGNVLSRVGSLSSVANALSVPELPSPNPSPSSSLNSNQEAALLENIDMSKLIEMAGPIMNALSNN